MREGETLPLIIMCLKFPAQAERKSLEDNLIIHKLTIWEFDLLFSKIVISIFRAGHCHYITVIKPLINHTLIWKMLVSISSRRIIGIPVMRHSCGLVWPSPEHRFCWLQSFLDFADYGATPTYCDHSLSAYNYKSSLYLIIPSLKYFIIFLHKYFYPMLAANRYVLFYSTWYVHFSNV